MLALDAASPRDSGSSKRAVQMKRFFYREKGNADEAWYYLARDVESGAVYVEHQWASSGKLGSNRIEISDFVEGPYTTASNNLLRFVGAIIEEDGDAPSACRRKKHLN
jgi:hypothetical protein